MAKAVQLKDKNGNKIFAAPWMPIGSIFLTVSNDNPSKYFGGTWEKISGGFLYGCTSSIDNNTSTGVNTSAAGSRNTGSHKLTVDEMPAHQHYTAQTYGGGGDGKYFGVGVVQSARVTTASDYWWNWTDWTGGNVGHTHSLSNHSHVVSHIGVWVWKRIK